MRKLEKIRQEAEDECLKDNCQSWPIICLIAMEKAIKEFSREAQDKIDDIANVEQLLHPTTMKQNLKNYFYRYYYSNDSPTEVLALLEFLIDQIVTQQTQISNLQEQVDTLKDVLNKHLCHNDTSIKVEGL